MGMTGRAWTTRRGVASAAINPLPRRAPAPGMVNRSGVASPHGGGHTTGVGTMASHGSES